MQEIVQNLLEFTMAGNSFPWDIQSDGVVGPPYNGAWVVVSVPEIYVGAMLDRAATYGISPTQYLQGFINDMVQAEQFA